MENLFSPLSGGFFGSSSGTGLALQLAGQPMDLAALDVSRTLHQRDVNVGLATAFLRVLSDEGRRAREIMAA